MNDKIYKLAVEVGIIKEEEGYFWIQSVDPLEKFAEAIVRQCIKSTLSLHDAAIKFDWDTEETFHMVVDTIVEDLDMQHILRS